MQNDDYTVRGEKIRGLRIRKRLTQQRLAQAAGLSLTQVSRIETGAHRPRFSTLEALAEALGVDADDLIDYAPLVA
jgi:transcriptional regulator with XRE-family HTH domain